MDLEGLRYLVAIADAGSIQAAASSLSAARATVRRRLLEAEAEVGAPLFRRTTKGLVPTPAGAVIVGGGRKMVAEAGILVRAASTLDSEPNGPLRVIVPPGFHPGLINEIVRALRASFSKLTIDFRIEDRPLASLQDTVDLAIIVGDFPVPDTWTVVGKTPIPQRLLASREYLDSHSPVEQPADLAQHVLFAYQPGQAEPIEHLPLLAGGEVPIRPAATSNDILTLHYMAECGTGIAWVPDGLLPPALAPLVPTVPVLEDVIGRTLTVRLLSPKALANAAHVSRMRQCIGDVMART
jgi:DNA-binding transcriptional LysR family regulator